MRIETNDKKPHEDLNNTEARTLFGSHIAITIYQIEWAVKWDRAL